MLEKLSSGDRMRLMQFVCSFAWADLEVRLEERRYIAKLIERLDLDADERVLVQAWLKSPPEPDPMTIPNEHRAIFVQEIKGVIISDGEIADEERESLALLETLLDEDAGGA
jgi:uncharacterized membrane protein YebE (DUF533 family)